MGVSVHALIAILLCILTILGKILRSFFLPLAGDLVLEAENVSFHFEKSKNMRCNTDGLSELEFTLRVQVCLEAFEFRKGRFILINTSLNLFQCCLVC